MDFSQSIDREQLREVFRSPFDPEVWDMLLRDVFGANKMYVEPRLREIDNGGNEKVTGYDLGEIVTPDNHTIGLFRFEIKAGYNIPMNKAGLRGFVEKDIKYFYDAALVVFYNETQWRLSYICDMQEGKTAPKRFTYVFGDPAQTYRTPIGRFEFIKAEGPSRKAIHEAFSVEALNKDFYRFIADRFYQLVGATTGKGKNKTEHRRIMHLPGDPDNLTYQEFAVRLIGRTVFCWFLKEKKSAAGVPLLPEALLSSESLRVYPDYYHSVLERIFFQTLNTPVDERVDNLPDGCGSIPFLNGGLFDYHPHDFYVPQPDGLSGYRNELVIPDEWFASLFTELEQYNFTIDENSPEDMEVSVDPEMLGRIFENLLAEIDPDSGETARKATGSFYTPREIVDYMAVESLVYYLERKTAIDRERLYPLFKPAETPAQYGDEERIVLLEALDALKILDPACGSGAFPMGILMKITGALQILDRDAVWWKRRQIERIDNAAVRQQMQEKFAAATVEYARKIGIIQNTLYGVDIQPIAAEISKLRCFLTLIVDENVDDAKPNRGVEPLPNLEFKFVTADSLVRLPGTTDFGGLFADNLYEFTERLRQLRIDYMQSYGTRKREIKEEYLRLQGRIGASHSGDSLVDKTSREYLISQWDPFGNAKSEWFDPEWMFGVRDGFDIVIGNPPYVNIEKIDDATKDYLFSEYTTCKGRTDLYIAFIERGLHLLDSMGMLSFIIPYAYTNQKYGVESRKNLISNYTIKEIVDTSDYRVFDTAVVKNIILTVGRKSKVVQLNTRIKRIASQEDFVKENSVNTTLPQTTFLQLKDCRFETKYEPTLINIKNKLWRNAVPLEDICLVAYGARLNHKKKKIKKEFYIHKDYTSGYKPFTEGRNVERYHFTQLGWLDYRSAEHYNPMFSQLFENPKLMTINVVKDRMRFVYDDKGFYNSHTVINCTKWHLLATCRHTTVKRNVSPKRLKLSEKFNYKYLLGILNSTLLSWYFASFLSESLHLYPEDAKNLPILLAESSKQKEVEEKVDEILNLKSADINADTASLEAEIDRMVYELYGFTEDEIAVVEGRESGGAAHA